MSGTKYQIVPKITFGAKAFHFSTKTKNQFKAITNAHFKSIPNGSNLFLSFGEIDCRPDEGFIHAATKNNLSIEGLIYETLKGYINWFSEHNENKNHRLTFLNLPAPIYNKKCSTELNREAARTIKLFNEALTLLLLDYDFNLIDVFKFTVGDDGFSNGLFHIDDYHLSISAITEIEKQTNV